MTDITTETSVNETVEEENKMPKLPKSLSMTLPNDKLAKKLFTLDDEIFQILSGGEPVKIVEIQKPLVKSELRVEVERIADILQIPPDGFDKSVFLAVTAIQELGIEFVIPEMVYQILGGNKKDLSEDMRNEIIDSIRRLSKINVLFDMSALAKKIGYDNGDGKGAEFEGHLLPVERASKIIDGREMTVYKFLEKNVLLRVAQRKGQLLTINSIFFSTPKLKLSAGSDGTVSLKTFIINRVKEIIGSHVSTSKRVTRLEPTITFASIYKALRLDDPPKRKRQQIRSNCEKILNHLREIGEIDDWNFRREKSEHGTPEVTAIEIKFTTKKQQLR